MLTLHIELLGDLHMIYGEESVAGIDTPRPRSAPAYLLLHLRAPQARHYVAFTLWPNSNESRARTNRRKHLFHLRRVLPDADRFLDVGGNTVQWRLHAPFRLDVAELAHKVDTVQQAEKAGNSFSAFQGV